MRRSFTLGLSAIAMAGFASLAQAEEVVTPPATHSATNPPLVAAATSPSATSPSATSPSAQTATAESHPDVTSPPKPKTAEARAPWHHLPPCQNPDLEEDGFHLSTDCSGVFGARLGLTHLRGVRASDAISLTVSAEGEEYVRRGIWTARTLHRLAIGGGDAGFEGTLLGGWAAGVRIPISPCGRHGPVLRAGIFGYLRGNEVFYGSLLELPQFQVGYQYQHGKTVVELGTTTGAVLVGRSRTGEARTRVLGAGFEMGGYAAVQLPWLRLGLSAARLPANDGLSNPVDVVEGTICGRALGFALCTDMRATVSDAAVVPGASASEVRSLYAGLSLGVTRE